jgi:hypothetical protein
MTLSNVEGTERPVELKVSPVLFDSREGTDWGVCVGIVEFKKTTSRGKL